MKKSKLPIAVIGLGKTGISIAKYLKKNNKNFICYDTRLDLKITAEIKKYTSKRNIILGEFKKSYIKNHDNFIISPGVYLNSDLLNIIKHKGKNIQTDIDIFNEKRRKNIICITGSNGKTTVTLIIEFILNNLGNNAKAGGNVGLPVLELLEENYDYNILELSSFQLEMTKKIISRSSLITNITPDHLDRHKTFKNYVNIKHKVFKYSKNIIINLSDDNIRKKEFMYKYSFGGKKRNNSGYFVEIENGTSYIFKGEKKLASEKDFKLIGNHNLLNICAALAIIESLDLDIEKSIKIIKNFKSIEHRMENFYQNNKLIWINDSKSTNIDSTISAVTSLKDKVILILGGRSKTNNYSSLESAIINKVETLVLFGECKKFLSDNIRSIKNTIIARDLHDAIIISKDCAKNISKTHNGNINIILSPACSSFDMFNSYEERGNFFKKSVLNIYR